MNRVVQKFIYYLLRFIHLQLFLMLVSWPILIAWGLPISLMSPVGNLLFGPLLTLFLLLSSLVFFGELLYLPTNWLIYAIEYLSRFWRWVVHQGSTNWLMGVAIPSSVILILIPAIAFAIIHTKKLKHPFINITALLLFTLTNIYVLKQSSYNNSIFTIKYGIYTITCKKTDHGINVYVPAAFRCQKSSINNWLEYTFIPKLIKATGNMCVDTVVLEKSTFSARLLAQALKEKNHVKNI